MPAESPTPGTPLQQAIALHEAGRLREAQSIYERILAREPENHHVLNLTGVIASQTGRDADAVDLINRAIALAPAAPQYHVNIGVPLFNLRRLDESLHSYQRAIGLDPAMPEAWSNMAQTLFDLRRIEESEAAARKAMQLRPDFPDAHWNLAVALLARGDYASAWPQYQWRLRRPATMRRLLFAVSTPPWNGRPIPGKTLLLLAEQGFGDAIQFLRYAELAAGRCGKLLIECPPPVARLARSAPGAANAFAAASSAADLPAHDFQCPLLSLPLLLGTGGDLRTAAIPYLHAEAAVTDQWRNRLDQAAPCPGDRLIGLAWAGNDLPNPRRTVGLEALSPLAMIDRTTFVSLQKGAAAAQAKSPPSGLKLIDLADQLSDFADTAALISCLDAVVTIDSAVAHLAGAMGKKTFTLLHHAADWRWHVDAEISDWYPTMRLFRQQLPGDWSDPVQQVAVALCSAFL